MADQEMIAGQQRAGADESDPGRQDVAEGTEPVVLTARPVSQPSGPRVWTPFVSFAALLGTLVFVSSVLLVAFIVAEAASTGAAVGQGSFSDGIDDLVEAPAFLLLNMIAAFLILCVFAFGAAILSPVPWSRRLRLGVSGLSLSVLGAVALGFLALSSAVDALFVVLGVEPGGSIATITNAFATSSLPMALALVVVCALQGGAEEIFFRGYVQTRLVQRWGRWPGILIAAALFGLIHLDPVHSLFAFGVGIYLGWITERTGSIRPAVVAHAANNALWGLSVALLDMPLSRGQASLLLVLCAAVTLAAVALLRGVTPAHPESQDASIVT